nr:KilA-N domain-containing protein [Pelistega ratti]
MLLLCGKGGLVRVFLGCVYSFFEIVKLGRGGGTFAHKDIAFKLASWVSVEFELYIIKDYQ